MGLPWSTSAAGADVDAVVGVRDDGEVVLDTRQVDVVDELRGMAQELRDVAGRTV